MTLDWKITNDYLEGKTKDFIFTKKFAMFDLDSTLIIPKIGTKKNGKGFPIDENDWKFLFNNTQQILNNLINFGYCIIIISNQGGIEKKKQTVENLINKVNKIANTLNINMYFFCSTGYNKYRKPLPQWIYEIVPEEVENNIDRKSSFYCGDACGRKNDFSDTDYKFAINCMLNFKTPENLFLGEPNNYLTIKYPIIESKKMQLNFVPKNKEIIVMIGCAGSGKSYVSKYISKKYDYITINQDILKSKVNCVKICNNAIINKKNIIIDSTNPGIVDRKIWIDIAKKNNYKIRSIELIIPFDNAMHNNYYRNFVNNVKLVPNIAYNIFKSKYIKPSIEEGFNEVIECASGTPNDFKYFYYMY